MRDKIFLLSVDEAEKYFKSYEERKCYPTPYAVDQGAYDDSFEGVNEYGLGPSFWWLRSCCGMEQRDAAQVSICGDIYFGEAEDREGNKKSTRTAIRPALWIDVNM